VGFAGILTMDNILVVINDLIRTEEKAQPIEAIQAVKVKSTGDFL